MLFQNFLPIFVISIKTYKTKTKAKMDLITSDIADGDTVSSFYSYDCQTYKVI